MSSVARPRPVENIPGYRDHRSGDRDRLSDERDQLIGISPESVIAIVRNLDRHGPELVIGMRPER
jgi:hypothetical protein